LFVATDHAPCPLKKKSSGSIWTDHSGIPGCETMISYLFSEGLLKNRIDLSTYLQITSENAARKFGFFNRKGSLEIGKDADIYIVNPNDSFVVTSKNFFSKGRFSPFEQMIFNGKIIKTFVRGVKVFDSKTNFVGKAGYGKFINTKA
jgi:dihydroorotase-like cyclic amidohydrolase